MAPSTERKKKTKKEKRELVMRLFRNHGKEEKDVKKNKEIHKHKETPEQKAAAPIAMTPGPTSGRQQQGKQGSGSLKPSEHETDEHLAHTVFENVKNSKPAVVNEKASKLKWKGGVAPPPEDVEATKTSDGATSTKEEETKEVNHEDEDQPTVFEEIEGGSRPAVVNEKPANLQWKKKKTPEKKDRTDKTDGDEVQGEEAEQTADKPKGPVRDENFMIACKLMIQIRQCNILENILMDVENSILRRFFEEQMENPTNTVIELLHKAIDLCYEKIVFHGDQYDIYLDAEAYIFIKNKDLAKSKCLDVLMTVPDCLPLRWGGKNIGVQLCEDLEAADKIVTQANHEVKMSKSKMMAPIEGENGWTPMLKEAADDKNTKDTEAADDKSNSDKDKPKEVKKPRKKRILNISMREAADLRKENEMREERDRLIAARKEAQLALRPMVAPAPVSNKATPSPNKKPAVPAGVTIQPAPKNNKAPRKAITNGNNGVQGVQGTSKKVVKTPQEQEAQRKGLANYFRATPSKPPPKKK